MIRVAICDDDVKMLEEYEDEQIFVCCVAFDRQSAGACENERYEKVGKESILNGYPVFFMKQK